MTYQLRNIDNFDNFPKITQHDRGELPPALAPLLSLDHWVIWRWEPNAQGKWTKPPFQARNPLSNARVNDPSTWADYSSACEAVERRADVDGIGFTLTDTPYAAFDLDDAVINRATGEVSSWAMQLIEKAGSYTEYTPSGTGICRLCGQDGQDKRPSAASRPILGGKAQKTLNMHVLPKSTK